MRELFKIRDYRLLWGGQAVSNFDDALTMNETLALACIIDVSRLARCDLDDPDRSHTPGTLAAGIGVRNVFLVAGAIAMVAAALAAWMFRGAVPRAAAAAMTPEPVAVTD